MINFLIENIYLKDTLRHARIVEYAIAMLQVSEHLAESSSGNDTKHAEAVILNRGKRNKKYKFMYTQNKEEKQYY